MWCTHRRRCRGTAAQSQQRDTDYRSRRRSGARVDDDHNACARPDGARNSFPRALIDDKRCCHERYDRPGSGVRSNSQHGFDVGPGHQFLVCTDDDNDDHDCCDHDHAHDDHRDRDTDPDDHDDRCVDDNVSC